MKKYASKLLPLLYAGIFIYSAFLLVQYFYTYYVASKSLTETQEIYETALENVQEPDVVEDPSKLEILSRFTMRPSFADLYAENEQVVGWISVEGTKLNNPILQATDNEFYLDHNFEDKYSRAGSIFMDYRNDMTDMSRNTVLYGHAMKDGSMFGNLKEYAARNFASDHSVIQFDTLYDSYEIEVFAAYETTIDFYYIETNFKTDEDFMRYIDEVNARSFIKMPIDIKESDKIITLSTCNNSLQSKDKRFVVQGRLVKK